MLVKKLVQIDFANPKWNAADHIQDIRKAVESASLNLFSRHNVRVELPIITDDNKVIMEVRIPQEKANSFSIGNHCRGISAYLLKYCNQRYEDAVIGKRLLNYVEISEDEMKKEKASMTDYLEAISDFAKLLERSDEESQIKIKKIFEVLYKEEE